MPPPRLSLASGILAPSRWSFATSTSARFASTVAQRRRRQHDPYAAAQARARRAANISRQATLQAERSAALGDPVRGVSTPFVESFDTARAADAPSLLNHYIAPEELRSAMDYSRDLSTPVANTAAVAYDEQRHQERVAAHKEQSETARIALERITSISNASTSDRTRINIQRCIDQFGRHNTDGFLRGSPARPEGHDPDARSGPDTGSSEVQAAILTARIRALANALESTGKKDMANKRNLRLMVHKRQKLLQYLRRKERGGERWRNLIETLGLTEGTWKGEISM